MVGESLQSRLRGWAFVLLGCTNFSRTIIKYGDWVPTRPQCYWGEWHQCLARQQRAASQTRHRVAFCHAQSMHYVWGTDETPCGNRSHAAREFANQTGFVMSQVFRYVLPDSQINRFVKQIEDRLLPAVRPLGTGIYQQIVKSVVKRARSRR